MDRSATAARISVVLGALGLAIALILYVPWRPRPFDLWDFPEFLPLLLRHRTMAPQFAAMVEHYAQEGRLNLLPYAALVLKWDAFGWHSTLWQMTRFLQMALIVLGVYFITRNFVTSHISAAWGAGLFVTAATAATAWIRLTIGEPLAVMCLIGAIALACRFQGSSRPTPVAGAIALLLLGALLSKEMIVATFPFVVLLAWSFQPDGSLRAIQFSSRNRMLLAVCAIALSPASIAIAMVALRTPSQSFSSYYGSSPLSAEALLVRFLVRFIAFLIPAWPGREPAGLALPVNVCFLTLLAFGWYVALRERDRRSSRLRLLGLLIGLPALGALSYLPWPSFADFYGLPYLLASAILVAVAMDAIANHLPPARHLAYAAAAFVILGTAVQAHHTARGMAARDEVNFALVRQVAQYPSVDTVYVASPVVPQEAWRLAARMARARAVFAPASDRPMPPIKDVPCQAVHDWDANHWGNVVLVSWADACGSIDRPTKTLIRRYSYLDPATLTARTDSFRVDLLASQQIRRAGARPRTAQ